MLEFEEEPHIYRWNGEVVPSVTQVLEPILDYDGIPRHVLDAAAERGREIHTITELYDYGTLGEFNHEYIPYLEAWIDFLAATRAEVELVEHRLYHERVGYAGTIDRILRIGKKRVLVDIKSTYKHMRLVGPQTAAYTEMFNSVYPDDKVSERWSVRLTRDRGFDRVKCKDRSDIRVFNSCLNIWRFNNQQ